MRFALCVRFVLQVFFQILDHFFGGDSRRIGPVKTHLEESAFHFRPLLFAHHQVSSDDQMDMADPCFDTTLPKPAAFQLPVAAERTNQNGIGCGLNGRADKVLLGGKGSDVYNLKTFTLQGMGHDLVPYHVGIHPQDP